MSFTINQIVRLAYRRTLLISDYGNPTDQQYRHARDLLQLLSLRAQTKGLLAHSIAFEEITLLTGISAYDLSTSAMDIVSTAMFIPAGVVDPANGELNVSPMTRDEWQSLSAKGAQGPPTLYYVDRSADTLAVKVWPVPSASENLARLRFQVHLFHADMDIGSYTPDFERFWAAWLVAQLGADLAKDNGLPVERVQMLIADAQAAFQDCRNYAMPRTPPQMGLSHDTGWHR
jgi:hypothetical protein